MCPSFRLFASSSEDSLSLDRGPFHLLMKLVIKSSFIILTVRPRSTLFGIATSVGHAALHRESSVGGTSSGKSVVACLEKESDGAALPT